MDERRIEQLLKRADGGALSAAPGEDLAARVLRIDRRRSVIRSVVACAAMIAIVVFVAPRLVPNRPLPVAAVIPHRNISRELAAMDADAAVHNVVAVRLLASEHAATIVPMADPLEAIALERERSAMILISQGDWNVARDVAAARRDYHRASDLFPETYSASIAKGRLDKLNNRKDG